MLPLGLMASVDTYGSNGSLVKCAFLAHHDSDAVIRPIYIACSLIYWWEIVG
ncbi:hypothetical protein [Methanosarcina horonobensis]|uniref:hypothetical protein n=1 Tax=Methanosarcina horonobensis TaxID=418008 RepID=UPI0013013DE3|nr:hypothetical protein [Methanosarcina horonobensis]